MKGVEMWDMDLPAEMRVEFTKAMEAGTRFAEAVSGRLVDFTVSAYEGVPGVVLVEFAHGELDTLSALVEREWK